MSIKEHITVGKPCEINPGIWTCQVTWSGPSCRGSQSIPKHRSTHYEAKQDAEMLARRIAAQEKTAVTRGDMPTLPAPKFDPSDLKALRDELDAEEAAKEPPIMPANLAAAKDWAEAPVSLHTSPKDNFDLALRVGGKREWVVSLGFWDNGSIPPVSWHEVYSSWDTTPVWTGSRSQFNFMRSMCKTPEELFEMAKMSAEANDLHRDQASQAETNEAHAEALNFEPEIAKRDEEIASLKEQVNKEAAEANHYSALCGQLREKVKEKDAESTALSRYAQAFSKVCASVGVGVSPAVDMDGDSLDAICLHVQGVANGIEETISKFRLGAEHGNRRSKEMTLQLKRAQAMRDSWKASASESMGRHRDTAMALAGERAASAAYRVTSD